MNIGLGLLFLALGIVGVIYNQNIYNFTGRIDWVESRFRGSTSTFIKFVAVIIVILGLLFITGAAKAITGPLGDALSKVFPKQ